MFSAFSLAFLSILMALSLLLSSYSLKLLLLELPLTLMTLSLLLSSFELELLLLELILSKLLCDSRRLGTSLEL